MVVIDRDSLRARLEVTIAIRQGSTCASGVFSVDLETWRRYVVEAGFVELTHYYRPAGLPREQQPWLATVWRREE